MPTTTDKPSANDLWVEAANQVAACYWTLRDQGVPSDQARDFTIEIVRATQ